MGLLCLQVRQSLQRLQKNLLQVAVLDVLLHVAATALVLVRVDADSLVLERVRTPVPVADMIVRVHVRTAVLAHVSIQAVSSCLKSRALYLLSPNKESCKKEKSYLWSR